MLAGAEAFSGFSTNDIEASKVFYAETLGLTVTESNGMLTLHLAEKYTVIIYPKGDAHVPATFTVLNFVVPDIEREIDDLVSRGVGFIRYPEMGGAQDERGIMRAGGPLIAWFTDPGGNILAVLEAS